MNDEILKKQLGANIAAFRKRSNMTQAALAEKINFSDKAVSKWERGESVPDILTLMELAKLFEITVDDLLRDHNALPANVGKVEQVMGKAVEKTLKQHSGMVCGTAGLCDLFFIGYPEKLDQFCICIPR